MNITPEQLVQIVGSQHIEGLLLRQEIEKLKSDLAEAMKRIAELEKPADGG